MTAFNELGLNAKLIQNIAAKGYDTPSPIQAKAIPLVLSGRDLMAAAQTGTGKTAAFTLPALHMLKGGPRPGPKDVSCMILTPTARWPLDVSAAQFCGLYRRGKRSGRCGSPWCWRA